MRYGWMLLALFVSGVTHGGELNGSLEFNTGYNNNVYLESDDLQTVATGSATSSDDVQQQLVMGLDYALLDRDSGDATLLLDHFYEKLFANELETAVTTAALPLSYYLGGTRFRVTPMVSRSSISGDAVLNSYGSGVDVARKLGRHHIGLNYERYEKRALDDRYEAYQGRVSSYQVYVNSRWLGRQTSVKAGRYANDYADTLAGNEGYAGWTVSASMAWWTGRMQLSLYGRVKSKDYEDYDGRRDVNTLASVTPSLNLTQSFNVFTSLEWTDNRSNLATTAEDASYRQLIALLGARVSF